MDIRIEKKKGLRALFTRRGIPYLAGAAFLLLVVWLLVRDHSSTLRIDARTISVGEVVRGEFNDYIRVTGQVQPITTVQLSPLEAGIVERLVVEEGASVRKGDVLVELSNTSLTLEILNSEAELAEKQNILRNTLISMEQEKLDLRLDRAQLDLDVERKRRTWQQNEELYRSNLIAREVAPVEGGLRAGRAQARSECRAAGAGFALPHGADRADGGEPRQHEAQHAAHPRADREPAGQVAHRRRGGSAGRRAGAVGLVGTEDRPGERPVGLQGRGPDRRELHRPRACGARRHLRTAGHRLHDAPEKVYPEVRNGQFRADFTFAGAHPRNIRSGQTYYLHLELGQPTDAVIIPRGSFYQSTGGAWIYVLAPEGDRAYKRQIRIGRQNPQYYEVLEGLEPGERVIVSGYENYGANDVLILNK